MASWRSGAATDFGLVEEDGALSSLAHRFADLKAVVEAGAPDALLGMAKATGLRLGAVTLLPPIPNPGKILCVGVNYPERNAEYKDGSELPKYPSLFVRFPGSFVGHETPILRPPESEQFDYEGEIVVVVGKGGRRVSEAQAHAHIFGFTLMNEGSIRDWIRHGKFNVTQGKNFDRSGAIGPWIVPISAATPPDNLTVMTRVNGEERQRGNTGTLAFSFARIIAYVSTFTTLEPGDLIATGTPPGAGGRFDPPRWLKPGDVVEVESPEIGLLRNTVEDEKA
ncbi:MAG: 2-hydroxyhepta-2,4-diene-1,7-dioate isomerase [Rhizobiales bacterium PAR1]|nr:MAG: 2-hydroxyhepta-2,4-diene-1,7-dioate isomerase [Rhizobiales bacterium PAR1]